MATACARSRLRAAPPGKELQRRVSGAETATGKRPPDHGEGRKNDSADHGNRRPGRLLSRELEGEQYPHRGDKSCYKKLGATDHESGHAGRHVEHEEDAEQRPRRYCKLRLRRYKEQKSVTNQQQVNPTANDTGLGRIPESCPVPDEQGANDREYCESRDHNQRRDQCSRHIRRHPPCGQDDPRQYGPCNCEYRNPARRSLQEEAGVEHHQQQGEAPKGSLRRSPESEEKEQRQTDE